MTRRGMSVEPRRLLMNTRGSGAARGSSGRWTAAAVATFVAAAAVKMPCCDQRARNGVSPRSVQGCVGLVCLTSWSPGSLPGQLFAPCTALLSGDGAVHERGIAAEARGPGVIFVILVQIVCVRGRELYIVSIHVYHADVDARSLARRPSPSPSLPTDRRGWSERRGDATSRGGRATALNTRGADGNAKRTRRQTHKRTTSLEMRASLQDRLNCVRDKLPIRGDVKFTFRVTCVTLARRTLRDAMGSRHATNNQLARTHAVRH